MAEVAAFVIGAAVSLAALEFWHRYMGPDRRDEP